jgi:hypothetical protein
MTGQDLVNLVLDDCEEVAVTSVQTLVMAAGVDMSRRPGAESLVINGSTSMSQVVRGVLFSKLPAGYVIDHVQSESKSEHFNKLAAAVNPRPKKLTGDL